MIFFREILHWSLTILEEHWKKVLLGVSRKWLFDTCKIGCDALIDWNNEIESEVSTPKKKKGRKLSLDNKLENKIKRLVSPIRKIGSVLNIAIVNTNEGILSVGRSLLGEKERHWYTRALVLSLMSRMRRKTQRNCVKKLSKKICTLKKKYVYKSQEHRMKPPSVDYQLR